MKFNYRQELKKFNEWWAKERQILEEENAAEETIQEIYNYSFSQFKADRNYYLHKEEYIDDGALSGEIDFFKDFDFIEQIENEELVQVLKSLKKSDYEMLIMLCVKGMSQADVAKHLGQTRANITQKMKRIKKLFENT